MADLDLTEAIGAGGEAANGMAGDWYCPRRHDTPRRACEFCVAEVAVTAAAPLIEAQVRAQIAAEIEDLDGEPLLKGLVSINPSAQATLEWAAATARGES